MAGRSLSWVYEFWHSHERGTLMNSGYRSADAVLDRIRGARTDDEVRQRRRGADARSSTTIRPRPSWPGRRRRARSRRSSTWRRSTDRDIFTNVWQWRPARPRRSRRTRVKRITSRFVLLIATAAVAAAGDLRVRVDQLAAQRHDGVCHATGNLKVAQAGRRTGRHVHAAQHAGAAVGRHRAGRRPTLAPWQQDRILKDYVLEFPEFREITIFDRAGRPLATSAIGTDPPDGAGAGAAPGRRSPTSRR